MKKILFVILSLCILLCSCNKESISVTENQQDGNSEKLQFEENQNEQGNLENTENEFNIDDYQIQIPAEPVLHVYPIELGSDESSKKCSCSSCENFAQCIACPYVIIGGSEVEVEESYLTDLISGAVDLNEIYRRYYSEEYESFEEYLYKKELLEIETIKGIKLRSDQSLWRLRFTRNNYSIKSILGYEDENLQIINKTLEYVLNEN